MTQRSKMIAVGALLAVVALGAALQRPARKWFKSTFLKRVPSTGRFDNPEGLAIDSQGTFYVGNQNNSKFMILDKSGKTVKEIRELEGYHNGAGEPHGFCRGLYIVVPEPGRVIQTATHNVVEFDVRGEKPRLIRIFGSMGSGPGQMDGPEGLSRDGNGDLYVTDEHNLRVNVFDAGGKYLRSWPVPQDLQCVTVREDRVYVSQNKRNYIAVYSKEGVEKFRIGHEAVFPLLLYLTIPGAVLSLVVLMALKKTKPALLACAAFLAVAAGGSGLDFWRHHQPGEFRLPDDLAFSPDQKEIFIVDRLNNRIQVTDPDGRFKRVFGRKGSAPGELIDPKQLAFDLDGNLWVADSGNHRLQAFTRDGAFLKILE
jgi:DNA-binding beta-propeller fold protein YncE